MTRVLSTSSAWYKIARRMNQRIIRTSYWKSAICFAIAVAICLLFWALLTHLSTVR